VLLILLLIAFGKTSPVLGQAAVRPGNDLMLARSQPPMKNVFFNVLWGSLTGGMLLMGWSTLDDSLSKEDRFKFSRLSHQFLVGATYGGLGGLAAGVYLSIKGITFDENLSRIAFDTGYEPIPPHQINGHASLPSSGGGITLFNYQYRF
jgi:hypothetical protein